MITGDGVQNRQGGKAVHMRQLGPKRLLSPEARRRLGRVYAFLMTLEPKEAPDAVEAARPGASEAGNDGPGEAATASEL